MSSHSFREFSKPARRLETNPVVRRPPMPKGVALDAAQTWTDVRRQFRLAPSDGGAAQP